MVLSIDKGTLQCSCKGSFRGRASNGVTATHSFQVHMGQQSTCHYSLDRDFERPTFLI